MRSGITRLLCVTAGLWLAAGSNIHAEPMGTGFTYQGQLKTQGIPLDGDVDLLFLLFDAESGGVPLDELTVANVSVVNGLFTVELDFGSSVFDGRALWVEIAVRYPHDPTDAAPFVTLSPRQAVTATPYALQTRGLFVDDDGHVGVGYNWPEFPLHASTSEERAIFAVTENAEGKAIYGFGQALTGDNAGVWGQSSSDQGDGVYGWASSSTGITNGVYGLSWSDEGTGVFGHAFSSSGSTFGVHGRSNSDSGTGVYGYVGSYSGNTEGVYGRADSETGTGVYGWAWSTTGEPIGVKGGTRSENGTGVYGFGGLTGPNIGVHGHTGSSDGFAGYFTGGRNYFEGRVGIGTESPSSALHVETNGLHAIYANNTLSFGYGIQGLVSSSTGRNYGVYGESMSDEGYGVYGYASAETGNTRGVYGYSNSPTGRGVYGFVGPTGGVNYGVYGHSNSTHGHGVVGYHGINSGPGIGVKGRTASPDGYAGYFEGGRSYFEGNVGIGTESPGYPLDVQSDGDRTINALNSSGGYAVYGESNGGTAGRFKLEGTSGSAVVGGAESQTGTTFGGRFVSESSSGYAIEAVASSLGGTNYGVYGESKSPDGYAGYFQGYQSCFLGGNVGIGTDAPQYRLHVELTGNRAIYAKNNSSFGEAVYGHASRANGTTHAIHGKAESPDAFAGYFEGGKNYFEGKVGFGTDDPDYPIHVESDAFLGICGRTSATNGSAVYGSASAFAGETYGGRFISSSESGCGVKGTASRSSGVNYGVRAHTASPAGFAGYFTGGRNYFEGKVGIGTDSPACKLDVLGLARVRGTDWPISGQGMELAYSSALNTGYIQVYNRDSAAWGTLYLGDGNVGIGTETPGAKLELGGTDANIKVHESGGSPFLEIGDDTTDKGYLQWWSPTDRLLLYTDAHASPVAIGPTDSGGIVVSTEANNGNVGIGNALPQAKLHIDSTADVDPFRVRVDGITKFAVKRNGRTNVGSNNLPGFQLEVSGEGTAGKPGGGSWSSSSDRRLKKNIRDLEGSLDRLLQLRSVSFEYRDPEAINELPGERIGMIAQEVEEVFPDWVETGGHGYKILTFRGFEALTVDALRELRDEKNEELEQLRARNADLELRIAQLEALVGKMVDSVNGAK